MLFRSGSYLLALEPMVYSISPACRRIRLPSAPTRVIHVVTRSYRERRTNDDEHRKRRSHQHGRPRWRTGPGPCVGRDEATTAVRFLGRDHNPRTKSSIRTSNALARILTV